MNSTADTSLFLPADGRCLPQEDGGSTPQSFEQRLRRKVADAVSLELEIQRGRVVVTRELLAIHGAELLHECEKLTALLQGGLERSQPEPHKLTQPGSTPGPATHLPERSDKVQTSLINSHGPEPAVTASAVSFPTDPFPNGRW
jgi:hypothetical protein